MDLILEKGRPSDCSGRLIKELAVYDFLDSLNIPYETVTHPEAATMEACAAVDKLLFPAAICKNLLLTNSQKNAFYLLMIKNSKKFKTKEISSQINSARLSFASGEMMEELLNITPGSLSVMGLIYDKENRVKLLIDRDIMREEFVGCHPCINTASLKIRVKDLLEIFLPAVSHTATEVILNGED